MERAGFIIAKQVYPQVDSLNELLKLVR